MRVKKLLNPFIFLSLFLIFFLNVNKTYAQTSNSILNTSEDLGIFRDLTDSEIKDYYQTLEKGLKGDELLSSLQPILKTNQIKLKYNSGSSASTAWDGYYLLDRDYELSPLTDEEIKQQKVNKTDIWMDILYSTEDIYVEDKINSGTFKYINSSGNEISIDYKNGSTQFDREHVFPKSFGFNGNTDSDRYKDLTAGCDMQNLHAGEHNGNSSGHSNYPYGNVLVHDDSTKIVSGITGKIIGYTGANKDGIKVFEPLDEDKGDIARTIFYMCARYHTYEELGDNDNTPALTLADGVDSVKTLDPEDTKESPSAYGELSDLLKWNELDPVSEFEIHRNNLCYNAVQYNRNPFVDYPQWANIAFSDASEGINVDTDQINGSASNDNNDNKDNNKVSLDVSITSNAFKKGESINSSNIVINLNDEVISLSDLTLSITINGITSEVTNAESYVFDKTGDYAITLSYTDKSSNETYTKKINITVNTPYSIKASSSKTKFIKGESFDLSMLKVMQYNNDIYEQDLNEYRVYIIDHDGTQTLITDSYKFDYLRPTSYKILVETEVDGDTLTSQFSVDVELSNTNKIIILVIVVAIIIVLLFIFILIKKNSKKKKRNKSTKKRK